MESSAKIKLLQIFSHALTLVSGEKVVSDYLQQAPVAAEEFDLLAIGKAAASMALGAYKVCDSKIKRGLVITKDDHVDPRLHKYLDVQILESAHPYPDQRTLDSGQALLDFCESLPAGRALLVLVSGGASSLVDCIGDNFGFDDLRRLTEWLLASGMPIDQINRVRKSVSKIKAGRLAVFLQGHPVTQLLISDVPGDDPAVIGSGLLVASDNASIADEQDLPGWINEMATCIPVSPSSNDQCFSQIESHILATNSQLREYIAMNALKYGYAVRHNTSLSGDWQDAANQVAQTLRTGMPGLYIWGGEVTVRLPDNPGSGGRCQQMALYLADLFQGDEQIMILAVGSDGTDGPTQQAGALVDGETIIRGIDGGFDAQQCLADANAAVFLQASGDLIDTGPGGTNVMDVVVALKSE